jgi:hypothetical protein
MFRYLIPNELLRRLRKDEVPSGVQVGLLTILFFCQCLFYRPGIIDSLTYRNMLPLALLNFFMVLACLWGSYFCNGGSKGKNFFSRYIALSAVLYLWIYICGYLIYMAIYCVARLNNLAAINAAFNQSGIPQAIFMVVTSSLFLLTLLHYMYRVAHDDAT